MDDYSYRQMVNGERAVTVSELNGYVKNIVDNDLFLCRVSVKGEISNFTNHRSGHLYFSVKDESSLIRAVMFRSDAQKLTFLPEDGMKVVLHGRVSVFTRDGQYQFYVSSMEPDGVGALYLAFEKLKKKLAAEGLFDEEKKKPLPKIPKTVGVITSPTGAAIRDIIQILGRRFPFAEVLLYPALVQGTDAPADLCRGVEYFNEYPVDVVIIGRGGGSMEDLWAFNDETLARTVAASEIPIISAVGHEVDFTICDFVADRRAPTPSAAAEIAVPETGELQRKIENVVSRMRLLLENSMERKNQSLRFLSDRRVFTSPLRTLDDRRMLLLKLSDGLTNEMDKKLNSYTSCLSGIGGKLDALSPLLVFSRGYAMATKNGQTVKSLCDVAVGDAVSVRLSDGAFSAEITEIRKDNINAE